MIELEKTYISSSMEAQIAEMMGRDENCDVCRFYYLFSSLVFDKKKKELRFPTLREFWKSGVAVKRYLEYPCKSLTAIKPVWNLLSQYLRKGSYIVNFVDEKKVCEDIVLILSIDEKKRLITIRYKQLIGDVIEKTLLFEEYVGDFLSESVRKHLLRFDIFDVVKQEGRIDRKELWKHMGNAKLSFWDRKKCMKKATDMDKVLSEWYIIFQKAISCFLEKGVINQSPLNPSDDTLFSSANKNFKKKLKRYDVILSNVPTYITGEGE